MGSGGGENLSVVSGRTAVQVRDPYSCCHQAAVMGDAPARTEKLEGAAPKLTHTMTNGQRQFQFYRYTQTRRSSHTEFTPKRQTRNVHMFWVSYAYTYCSLLRSCLGFKPTFGRSPITALPRGIITASHQPQAVAKHRDRGPRGSGWSPTVGFVLPLV